MQKVIQYRSFKITEGKSIILNVREGGKSSSKSEVKIKKLI